MKSHIQRDDGRAACGNVLTFPSLIRVSASPTCITCRRIQRDEGLPFWQLRQAGR